FTDSPTATDVQSPTSTATASPSSSATPTPSPTGGTTLSPGDLAFTAFDSVGKQFSVVLLTGISDGTQLEFTNSAWGSATVLSPTGKILVWTADADYPAGTQLNYVEATGFDKGSLTQTVGTGGLGIKTTAGLDLTAFQGVTWSPTALAAMVDGEAWNSAGFPLPAGLVDGSSAWSTTTYFSGGYYNCFTVLGSGTTVAQAIDAGAGGASLSHWTPATGYAAAGALCGYFGTPGPTKTSSASPTAAPTATASPTFTANGTFTGSPTANGTFTDSPTATAVQSARSTPTDSPTSSPGPTATPAPAGTLAVGAIAFTGYASDAAQFSFVALQDLPSGTVLCFTNAGYDAPGGPFDPTDLSDGDAQVLTFTATALITAGQQVVINGKFPSATLNSGAVVPGSVSVTVSSDGTMGLKAKGDQLFAFQGSTTTPILIAGINVIGSKNTAGWLSSGSEIKQTSYLPNPLSGGGAVDVGGGYDTTGAIGTNAAYNCAVTSGGAAAILAALDQPSHWTADAGTADVPLTGTGATVTLCGFTVGGGGGGGSPTHTPVPTPTGLVFAAKPMLGPVPQHSGQPVILGLPKPAAHSEWWVYSMNFKLVSTLKFGQEKAAWSTAGIAAGVYRVKCKVTYLDGSTYEGWHNIALVP
ncbi:MAG TPA: hypothetical protein VK842_02595, partial [bacterium]|nr:hypothetical protein [bacterium]